MANLSKDNKNFLRSVSSSCHLGNKNLYHQIKLYVESEIA